MTSGAIARSRGKESLRPRIGFFGILGAGNIGNDGSLESVLQYLTRSQPHAVLDAMCSEPEVVAERHGIPATRLHWHKEDPGGGRGVLTPLAAAAGKVIDAWRTASWVRQHDVVIVPGMGVLEATLPLRAWGFPYALLLVCASGRMFDTRVALVGVGADAVRHRVTKAVLTAAARMANYRSYRDELSKDSMREMGVDTSDDHVYTDLVFALPLPAPLPDEANVVGVGVMAYYGGNDDRPRSVELHAAYLNKIRRFSLWLVDNGWQVRLFTGDDVDAPVARDIVGHIRQQRPALDPASVTAEPTSSLNDLMKQMTSVSTVIASRYHNVLCAVKLSKPTISIGYAKKNSMLMSHMGLADFCQDIKALDVDRLIDQFTLLQSNRQVLLPLLLERNALQLARIEKQFQDLTEAVFTKGLGSGTRLSTGGGDSR